MQQYEFLSPEITQRLLFATSTMHAFARQWACQIVNNPQICTGLGLTDGEGVERLWSWMRKLIAVTRGCGIRHQLKKGVQGQHAKAQQIMEACGVEIAVLRSEWELQKASELSIRAQAPVHLKKELDVVLALQGDFEASEKTLQATRSTLSKMLPSPEALRILSNLQDHHERLKDSIEELYLSLSIQELYPELQGVDLEFINVRKRAVGSFFEWERLDQASGGRGQTLVATLGTKLHQATHTAIKKHAPALMAELQKYNDVCATLATMYKPEWNIPLPGPLSTELKPLCDATNLLEDVWISHPMDEVPHWLGDAMVQEGIRAMLKVEWCTEELRRLQVEAVNLTRWFGCELAAVELALIESSSMSINFVVR
ncbi:hypothetical protein C0993_012020 [Termitomyces sp. T159_Od127]|nr:hypothetical protein C0993_012020 [Termitomyces sp. T159_Od127]